MTPTHARWSTLLLWCMSMTPTTTTIIFHVIHSFIHWHLSVSWDYRFAPIVLHLLWLWRPIRKRQSLPHLEQMKAVACLLARHTIFLWSPFSSAFTHCVSSQYVSPCFNVSVSRHLCLWQSLPNILCLCQVPGDPVCIRPWSVAYLKPDKDNVINCMALIVVDWCRNHCLSFSFVAIINFMQKYNNKINADSCFYRTSLVTLMASNI